MEPEKGVDAASNCPSRRNRSTSLPDLRQNKEYSYSISIEMSVKPIVSTYLDGKIMYLLIFGFQRIGSIIKLVELVAIIYFLNLMGLLQNLLIRLLL